MKRVAASIFLSMTLLSTAALAEKVKIEPDAILGPSLEKNMENTQTLLKGAVIMIRAHGWRCDSISGASMFMFSRGFSVSCNRFNYKYEFKDRGGNWEVELK